MHELEYVIALEIAIKYATNNSIAVKLLCCAPEYIKTTLALRPTVLVYCRIHVVCVDQYLQGRKLTIYFGSPKIADIANFGGGGSGAVSSMRLLCG